MTLDPHLRAPIAISLGAIAGALSRYYLTGWCTSQWGTTWPYGTFIINLSGCFLMGLVATLAAATGPTLISPELRLLLTTGFLGAYTTFSTYGLDTVTLAQNQRPIGALGYWAGSAVLGALAVVLGGQLGAVIARSAR
jgi:fluoride exporter